MTYDFDPDLATVVPALPDIDLDDLDADRATVEALYAALPPVDTTGVQIQDLAVPGPGGAPDLALRVYRPDEVVIPAGIYDVHGGGFVLGDLETNHARNVVLARELGVVLVSVDYRLAPESPYPAALEDTYAGLSWMAEHAGELGIDPGRIAVRGLSAGGGLAAGLALLARDRGGPAIAFQFLGYPMVDDRLATASMRHLTEVPLWKPRGFAAAWRAYLGDAEPGAADVPAYAAPARETDLAGLPPAYVSAMHFDPLRDEGIAYAGALLAAGVTVELHLFPGTFHGSSVVESSVSRRELDEEAAVLRRALGA